MLLLSSSKLASRNSRNTSPSVPISTPLRLFFFSSRHHGRTQKRELARDARAARAAPHQAFRRLLTACTGASGPNRLGRQWGSGRWSGGGSSSCETKPKHARAEGTSRYQRGWCASVDGMDTPTACNNFPKPSKTKNYSGKRRPN